MDNKNNIIGKELVSTQNNRIKNKVSKYNIIGNCLLEFFTTAGELRNKPEEEIIKKFKDVFNKDRELALRTLFYIGDIREGLGERRVFRICLKWLAKNHPSYVIINLENIAHYNRWDSVFELIDTPAEEAMWAFIGNTLKNDLILYYQNRPVSLLAKWMPSINASSKETKKLAKKCIDKLGFISEKKYRKLLSLLRETLNVTERLMSANQWDMINYEHVPSCAIRKYLSAFFKHDAERFLDYREKPRINTAKVTNKTLYPYNLIHNIRAGYDVATVEKQWKDLPNYIEGNNNIIVMPNCSSSMYVKPIETAVSLAVYFSEKNHGIFKGAFMSFSDPHIIFIDPSNSFEFRYEEVLKYSMGFTTNLEKAFEKILIEAELNDIPKEDIPKALMVISDIEIDPYFTEKPYFGQTLDFIPIMEEKFKSYGYKMPKLVLWNVKSKQDTILIKKEDVLMFSGHSPATFKNIINFLNFSPEEVIRKTLMDKRYDRVVYIDNI